MDTIGGYNFIENNKTEFRSQKVGINGKIIRWKNLKRCKK